ncbi:MAG: low molecular weight protein arginine phosphatase [Anaerolineales bacterium]|nr:low molecular weight protein arginine phosphatase [Anaerolineales bacterium]
MASVIFVCTANICRSPMAEALFKLMLNSEGDHWRVESAGTWAEAGLPASQKAQQVIAEMGGDLSQHRSRPVERSLLDEFDLILTMEQGQKEALRAEFPELAPKVFGLREILSQAGDIRDPHGSSLEDYQATAREIALILGTGLEKIRSLTGNQASPG